MRLTNEEIINVLLTAEKWELVDEKWIEKKFRFQEFMQAIHFTNEVAKLSEEYNHHPFISIDYKLVTLRMTSWNARGLTKLDFTLAKEFNQVYKKMKI